MVEKEARTELSVCGSVTEFLPSMHKVLGSVPSTTWKKDRQMREESGEDAEYGGLPILRKLRLDRCKVKV